MTAPAYKRPPMLRTLANFIFWTRWLQAPLYVGLIVAQGVYVYHFWVELVHLVEAIFGNEEALQILINSVGYQADGALELNETVIMLVVLALIDVVMISNLLIMVIVGGYETFVSRLELGDHPDQPEWLSSVNASVLKVKLATAIIGISSIHLLKTFISAEYYEEKVLLWQTVIHLAFLLSAMAIALCDRILPHADAAAERH
jgi:uncharacterized protein (TIGR00645 family)